MAFVAIIQFCFFGVGLLLISIGNLTRPVVEEEAQGDAASSAPLFPDRAQVVGSSGSVTRHASASSFISVNGDESRTQRCLGVMLVWKNVYFWVLMYAFFAAIAYGLVIITRTTSFATWESVSASVYQSRGVWSLNATPFLFEPACRGE